MIIQSMKSCNVKVTIYLMNKEIEHTQSQYIPVGKTSSYSII